MTSPTIFDRPHRPRAVSHAIGTRWLVGTVVVGVCIVAVASAIAWDGDVPGWEASGLEFINGWPDWLEPLVWVVEAAAAGDPAVLRPGDDGSVGGLFQFVVNHGSEPTFGAEDTARRRSVM